MKRLIFLTLAVSCLSFIYVGCNEPDLSDSTPDTEADGGENVNPDIPEGFEEEPDDPAEDPQRTFDYSLVKKAGHPR